MLSQETKDRLDALASELGVVTDRRHAIVEELNKILGEVDVTDDNEGHDHLVDFVVETAYLGELYNDVSFTQGDPSHFWLPSAIC